MSKRSISLQAAPRRRFFQHLDHQVEHKIESAWTISSAGIIPHDRSPSCHSIRIGLSNPTASQPSPPRIRYLAWRFVCSSSSALSSGGEGDQDYYIRSHSSENLAFHTFLRRKMTLLPNSHCNAYTCHYERLGECTFWTWEWGGKLAPLLACRPLTAGVAESSQIEEAEDERVSNHKLEGSGGHPPR